jgi:PhnB protein
MNHNTAHFAPYLYIPSGITDISFYSKAFGAVELRRWSNDDGTIHVAELSIGEALFHVHEEKISAGQLSPGRIPGTSVLIGLFVADVDVVMKSAVSAGARVVAAAETYDYGYRQGRIADPFGHIWLIESKI